MPEPMPPEFSASNSSSTLGKRLNAESRRIEITALLLSVLILVDLTRIQQGSAILNGLVVVSFLGLVAVSFSRLFKGLAATADLLSGLQSEIESLRQAVERSQSAGISAPLPEDTGILKGGRIAEIRRAIRRGEWLELDSLLLAFEDFFPDSPDIALLHRERTEAQAKVVEEVRTKIQAAKDVSDPDRVLELRESIEPVLHGEFRQEFDRELARWFMNVIQKRLRTGTVRVDVANLAGRVAALLDSTMEGASLRASLPTLRRAAGLCPKCGQPYLGTADACPTCVSQAIANLPAPKPKSSTAIPVVPDAESPLIDVEKS